MAGFDFCINKDAASCLGSGLLCNKPFDLLERIDVESLSPFVKVTFKGGNDRLLISVSNDSSPSDNNATIKSFNYGASTGAGCSLEIVDQQGGRFEGFLNQLNKDLSPESNTSMMIEFGWIKSHCDGNVSVELIEKPLYFSPNNVTATTTQGFIRYTIDGLAIVDTIIGETRADIIEGEEDNKVKLKVAIRNIFRKQNNTQPNMNIKVSFWRTDININAAIPGESSEESDWKFAEGEDRLLGPAGVWKSNQTDVLTAAMQWLSNIRTENNRGVIPQWDPTDPTGHIIFWEDPLDDCKLPSNICSNNYATYIVNGGNCSPVLSFEPQAKWLFSTNAWAGGGTSGPGSAGTEKQEGDTDCPQRTAAGGGTQSSVQVTQTAWDIYGPTRAARESKKSNVAHEKANRSYFPIEAEMRIVGDPKMYDIRTLIGKNINIIYINPFHIGSLQDGDCDWLIDPVCSNWFTSPYWIIFGVVHSIQEGSYVTTLKLKLPPTPGAIYD